MENIMGKGGFMRLHSILMRGILSMEKNMEEVFCHKRLVHCRLLIEKPEKKKDLKGLGSKIGLRRGLSLLQILSDFSFLHIYFRQLNIRECIQM